MAIATANYQVTNYGDWVRYQELQNGIDIYIKRQATTLLQSNAKHCSQHYVYNNYTHDFMHTHITQTYRNRNLSITVDRHGKRKTRGLTLLLQRCGLLSDKLAAQQHVRNSLTFKWNDIAMLCLQSIEKDYKSIINLPNDSTDVRWLYIKKLTGQCQNNN